MFKRVIIIFSLFMAISASAQFSRSYVPSVRTPQMMLNDEWGKMPVMLLGGDDVLQFSFDEMSHVYHRYTYRIVHCNADWSQSDLAEIDYIDGFNDVLIEDWENSVNTNQRPDKYKYPLH